MGLKFTFLFFQEIGELLRNDEKIYTHQTLQFVPSVLGRNRFAHKYLLWIL